jgi:hypothetical protein
MEELFVYSILYTMGIDCYDEYKAALDILCINNPSDLIYDLKDRDYKDAMLHLYSIMEDSVKDIDAFGKCLMDNLLPLYQKSDLKSFAKTAFKLCNLLPYSILTQEPFHTFSYADECLTFNDEPQCRELYEKALYFYR